eukprot:gene16590-16771_t
MGMLLGRPDDLGNILRHLKSQTQPPSAIVLSLEKPQDAPPELDPGVEVIFGPRGLCAQRNRGLDRILPHCDVVVFYDDDFVPTATSIEGLSQLFEKNPDIVGATGKVLADGITIGGVEYPDAKTIIEAYEAQWPTVNPAPKIADVATAYGCNMAYRAGVMQDLRFDERLPLYGWQEDVDFAGRIRKRGRMVVTDAFAGVHCGVYRSRMPGLDAPQPRHLADPQERAVQPRQGDPARMVHGPQGARGRQLAGRGAPAIRARGPHGRAGH